MAELFRRCGRIDLELRDLVGAGHARFLTLAATRRFDALLGAVAEGAAYCAAAITEPNVGSDLQALTTVAEPVAGGYRISGVKQHISRVEEATHFIVFAAVTRPDRGAAITAFLVPRDAPGLSTETMSPMGMATVSWGRVRLCDVLISQDARIGGEGQAISLFVRHFSYWRTMMAAAAVGCAQAAVDQAIDRLRSREAFGGPIGRFTHLQQGLAEHVARLRMAWLLVQDVAAGIGDNGWAVPDGAMAKAEAVETSIAAAEWSMGVFGASGYDAGTGLEKRYRDLIGLRFADGTTDVLRGQVARSVLGERLYELSLNRASSRESADDVSRRFFW